LSDFDIFHDVFSFCFVVNMTLPTIDLRIDRDALSRLDHSRLQVIATAYDSAKINNLVRFMVSLDRVMNR
jgi:hypothetical protein